MYQYILFDLDGTLTDSGPGIINSVIYALKKFSIEVEDREALHQFIGPPLLESFQKHCGFSEAESELAVEYYREYFRDRGLYENEVYDGIEELLIRLKEKDRTLIVATSKPEEFAVRILKYFRLDHYFAFIAGASMDSSRNKKADVIAYALERGNISELASAVMVGDREHDILGAKQVGLDSIGVLFGYGDEEELTAAGATYLAATAKDILRFV